jgi:hypothetical protein
MEAAESTRKVLHLDRLSRQDYMSTSPRVGGGVGEADRASLQSRRALDRERPAWRGRAGGPDRGKDGLDRGRIYFQRIMVGRGHLKRGPDIYATIALHMQRVAGVTRCGMIEGRQKVVPRSHGAIDPTGPKVSKAPSAECPRREARSR